MRFPWLLVFGCAGCQLVFGLDGTEPPKSDGAATVSCPDTYGKAATGTSYRFVDLQASWTEAHDTCLADGDGTHLAIPETATELAAYPTLTSGDPFWVGIARDDVDPLESYRTLLGDPVPRDDARWASGANEPDGDGPAVLVNNRLRDASETEGHVFLCECDGLEPTETFVFE